MKFTLSDWTNRLGSRFVIYGYLIYFCITIGSLLPSVHSDYCYIDELTLMAEAKRVLIGQYQHRDFFSFYGPGNFYLVALVWRLLGTSAYPPIKLLTFITITLT